MLETLVRTLFGVLPKPVWEKNNRGRLETSFRVVHFSLWRTIQYYFAPCKIIRIPESRKFLLVESGILGSGIQNPAFGIQDPAKKGNPESICWKSISNRINGFHPHPCNYCTVQFTHVVNQCSNLESVYITEAFKSHRICLEHQYSRYLIVLEHL